MAKKPTYKELLQRIEALEKESAGRKQAEEMLTRALKDADLQKEKFRTVVNNAPFGIVFVGKDGTFTHINPKLKELFGYDENEIPNGREWFRKAYPGPEYRRTVIAAWISDTQGAEIGEQRPRIFEVTCKDGKKKIVNFISVLLTTGENIVACEDITERKELEAQLRQAQKMEALGTLAGGIAHDFNNLLQAISGYTQLLLWGKSGDDPGANELKEIEKAAGRAAALIRQLLAFSRKVVGERKPVDLNQEIMDIESVLKRTLPKMIDIKIHLSEDLRTVWADPIQMEQILLNLGSNAADAMPEGGELIIETRDASLDEAYCRNHVGAVPGEYVLLTVTDTGHGMSRETVQHIFEPFFTTKEIGKGTGLGLASVYGIVKSHGGYVMCYSEVGQGTAFKIYLPSLQKGGEQSQKPAGKTLPKGGNETILIVDDEPSVREFTKRILNRFGYRVLGARNGEEALEVYKARKGHVDLVILDLGMPGMGGYACLRELLKIDASARVMIASGYAIDARVERTLKSGAAGYIGKPYQVPELLTKVRDVLDGKKGEYPWAVTPDHNRESD